MRSVLSNISTWLNLKQVINLEQVVKLPIKFFYFNNSDKCYKKIIEKLMLLGIEVADITANTEKAFWESSELKGKYVKLSRDEIFILALSKVSNMVLLTNNNLLIEAARQEGVMVKDIADILEAMHQKDLINIFEYKKAIENYKYLPYFKNISRMNKTHYIGEKFKIKEEDKLRIKRA